MIDAPEQAVHVRQRDGELIHLPARNRRSQYGSIRYSEGLDKAMIEPSVGSVGDSYDNAVAEMINGPTSPQF